ncbi:MAG: DNA repair protein RecO [Alphaproteobacteria bacterium]|nr:DNA repair protein RecO [Alphaproteobacteria bacterium]
MHYAGKAIVIQVTPYQDSCIITKLFTPEFGILSFIVKSIHAKAKTSPPKYLFFQVGSFIQIEFEYHALKNIQSIKNVHWHRLYKSTYHHVIKIAILMYITEVLLKVLVQPEKNEDLFQFIEDVLMLLDTLPVTETNNIPLFFLTKLSGFLGISIQANEEKTEHTTNDIWKNEPQNTDLNDPGFHILLLQKLVSQSTYQGYQSIIITTMQRRGFLNYLHRFYALHGKPLHPLKSIAIMQTIL